MPFTSRDGIDVQDAEETRVVDYLKIQVYDSSSNAGNPYTYMGKNPGGMYAPNGGSRGEPIRFTIYLYLPSNLSESYNTIYNETTLGPAGVGALKALSEQGAGQGGDLVQNIQQFAASVKPQFGLNAIASGLGAVNSSLGLEGSVSAQDINALVNKKVFNPYQEVTFRGVNYREHSFNFKMAPRNPEEARECYNIFNALRKAMLPSVSGTAGNYDPLGNVEEGSIMEKIMKSGTESYGGARYLNIPDYVRCSIVRVESTGSGETRVEEISGKGARLKEIMQFPTKMVITGLNMNVTPDGQMNTLKGINSELDDYGPAAMEMALTLKETAFITRDMIK